MALTTCPECEGKVSTEAQACPHCGMPGPFGVEGTAGDSQPVSESSSEKKPQSSAEEPAPDPTSGSAPHSNEPDDQEAAVRAAKNAELASLAQELAKHQEGDDFRVEMERQRLVSRIDKLKRELDGERFDDAARQKTCPHCGEVSQPDVDFCEGCGEALTAEPIVVPRPPPESQIEDDWEATSPSRENLPWIVGGAIAVVVVLIAVCSGIVSSVGETALSEDTARSAVLARLKAPSTAQFVSTEKFGEGTYFVVVDAQNSFGAMIRSRYCVVLPESGQSEQLFECTREEAAALFE